MWLIQAELHLDRHPDQATEIEWPERRDEQVPIEEVVRRDIHFGAEPDWSFVNPIPTIEMQLLDPPTSRRIWTVEYEGKVYVWSGYMGSFVGRLWKRWPIQAERNGKAIMRINGTRYERNLIRIQAGDELDGITAAITNKYPSQTTRSAVEQGNVWLFEAAPRNN